MRQDNDEKWWDYFSDQPYVLDARAKPQLGYRVISDSLITLATLCAVSPALLWRYLTLSKRPSTSSAKAFIGLSVSPDKRYKQATFEMVEDLGVNELLIRAPSWKPEKFDEIADFARQLKPRKILINILQNRQSVEDVSLWQQRLRGIFLSFDGITDTFQIANAVNRSKWGCYSNEDFFKLQNAAQELRAEFPTIKLLGSSVIDFEPMATLRTLINFQPYQLDGAASLLYVNRRLSPFNKQFGIFDLEKKIRLIYAILSLSNRSEKKLWITENNWPLLNTKPYTPNSGNPRSTVDEATQAKYLTQYYQIAHQTGMVEKCYWWQLINPGYGLVDSRGQNLRKMPSYFSFKNLLHNEQLLSGSD